MLFIIIGDGKLRDPMRDLAQRLSLSELVNFRGFIPYHSLPQHLQDIDIIINPSLRAWSETFCIANLEAMAMGIPIVTFAVGGKRFSHLNSLCPTPLFAGIGEYVNKPPSVEHDVEFVQVGNAVVVNEPSPTALASATLFLISHPEERKQIGIAGRTSILEYFSIARQMKQYAHVYSSIYKYSRGQLSDYTAS